MDNNTIVSHGSIDPVFFITYTLFSIIPLSYIAIGTIVFFLISSICCVLFGWCILTNLCCGCFSTNDDDDDDDDSIDSYEEYEKKNV